MTQLAWNAEGERIYQTGVDRGVLYVDGLVGVPWNGLVSVNEAPTGAEVTPYYYDGIKYRNETMGEEFNATLEAYTYPDEFMLCDGTEDYLGLELHQQPRKRFNLSYRTKVGNDVRGLEFGYKIHLVWNALASPTARSNVGMSGTPDPNNFTWALSTMPVAARGVKPTAHMVIDSRKTNNRLLAELERILYGTATTDPRFPTPAEIVNLYAGAYEIVLNRVTGLSAIKTFTVNFDLMGNREIGLYSIPSGSRVKKTSVNGLYRLDND